jgi:hypothetical protein
MRRKRDPVASVAKAPTSGRALLLTMGFQGCLLHKIRLGIGGALYVAKLEALLGPVVV